LSPNPVPKVRASAIYALGTFIGQSGSNSTNCLLALVITYEDKFKLINEKKKKYC